MTKKKGNAMTAAKKHSPADKKLTRCPPMFASLVAEDGQYKVQIPEGANIDALAAGLQEALGTVDAGVQSTLMGQLRIFHGASPEGIKELNTNLAILHNINPQNTLEGMLAVQMTGTHQLAMEMIRRSALKEQTVEGVDRNINRATKLLRLFTAQTEALQRLRGKTQQKVVVEHVTVNAGGQAIVGQVEHRGGRGNNGE